MKVRIAILLLLAIAQFGKTQDWTPNPKVTLQLHPLTLIDPNKPAVRAGFEVKLAPKWYLDTDAGFSTFERAGFRLRTEAKRMFSPKIYISLGAFYHDYTFKQEGLIIDPNTPEDGTYVKVKVNKSNVGGDFRLGYKVFTKARMVFDLYAGVGAMQRTRKHTPNTPKYRTGGGFFSYEHTQGTRVVPKFSLGFRWGFVLK